VKEVVAFGGTTLPQTASPIPQGEQGSQQEGWESQFDRKHKPENKADDGEHSTTNKKQSRHKKTFVHAKM